jgi:hypothetical protein
MNTELGEQSSTAPLFKTRCLWTLAFAGVTLSH